MRYNLGGDMRCNAGQLAQLFGWVRANDRQFLFDLLVPPTADSPSAAAVITASMTAS